MKASESEPKLHAIRKVAVSNAGQTQIDLAIMLWQASHSGDDEQTPENRGLVLGSICLEWRRSELSSIRDSTEGEG